MSTLPESEKDRRLAQMEREVQGLRDDLRTALEEHGTIQEELETSKEELQSTNQERTTTIEELRSRNRELAAINVEMDRTRTASDRARSYADAIIETVRGPLVVLDEGQRILQVNSAFCVSLEVQGVAAEGRLLRDIDDGRWDIPELQRRLRSLLIDAEAFEDWEVAVNFRRQGRRVMSLSARRIPGNADRTEQLLVAFEDVTARGA